MIRSLPLFSLFVASLALGGCQIIPPADSAQAAAAAQNLPVAVHAAPGQRFTAAEAAQCTSGGGMVMPRGRMQTDYCLTATRDAGQACRGDSDCAGACLSADSAAVAGQAVGGTCQPDNGPLFGCYAKVEDGKATGTICVD